VLGVLCKATAESWEAKGFRLSRVGRGVAKKKNGPLGAGLAANRDNRAGAGRIALGGDCNAMVQARGFLLDLGLRHLQALPHTRTPKKRQRRSPQSLFQSVLP